MIDATTICALATAPGGALGIIRISGSQSLEILSRVFRGSGDVLTYPANTIHYGHITKCWFPSSAPHTLTLAKTAQKSPVTVRAIY